MKTCNICNKPANKPFRVWKDDKIIAGCVDSCHENYLIPLTASRAWHNRRESKDIRNSVRFNWHKRYGV